MTLCRIFPAFPILGYIFVTKAIFSPRDPRNKTRVGSIFFSHPTSIFFSVTPKVAILNLKIDASETHFLFKIVNDESKYMQLKLEK